MAEDIRQRRLAPIYAAFDNGNYSQAARLCQKKDVAHWDLTKALLAYAFLNLRQSAEALQTARQLINSKAPQYNFDEQTLHTLGLTLKALRAEDELARVYESALDSSPTHEGFAVELFLCYILLFEYKKMQLLAQKLFKMTGKGKYIFWSAASMLLQPELPSALYCLAEKIIQKVLCKSDSSDSVDFTPGAEELELYIQVLMKQDKHLEALKALDDFTSQKESFSNSSISSVLIEDENEFKSNPSCVKMHELNTMTLRLKILRILHSISDNSSRRSTYEESINRELRLVLASYPDQWSAHIQAIDMIFMHCEGISESEISVSASAVNVELICGHQQYLISQQLTHSRLRGPFLSELELLMRWTENQTTTSRHMGTIDTIPLKITHSLPVGWTKCNYLSLSPLSLINDNLSETKEIAINSCILSIQQGENELFSEGLNLLCSYIDRFKSKQCCFSDIKNYVEYFVSRGPLMYSKQFITWIASNASLHRQQILSLTSEEVEQSSAAGEGSNLKRERLIELMCSFVKLLQIKQFVEYICPSLSASSLTTAEGVENLKLFHDTKIIFAGGIGGDREVHPGDELLLVSSGEIRKCLTQLTHAGEFELSDEIRVFIHSFELAAYLTAGAISSPHNYSFNLGLIDSFKEVALGEASLGVFAKLGVKHVQVDSMSYLLLPILYETGMYAEAKKQLRAVISFHASARRDTAEMIAKSFNFQNFSKSLELKEFLVKCSASIQLGLARTELPLLELTDRLHSHIEASSYLQEYAIGALHESHAWLSSSDMASLIDNADYKLLIRSDSSSSEEEESALRRMEQYRHRLDEGQILLKLVYFWFQGNLVNTCQHISELRAFLERSRLLSSTTIEESSQLGDIMTSIDKIALKPKVDQVTLCSEMSAADETNTALLSSASADFPLVCSFTTTAESATVINSSQIFVRKESPVGKAVSIDEANTDLPTVDSFLANIWELLITVADLAVVVKEQTSVKSADIDDRKAINVGKLQIIIENCIEKLHYALIPPSQGTSHSTLPVPSSRANEDKSVKQKNTVGPLSPEWLRRLSSFAMKAGTFVPLFLCSARNMLPKQPKKAAKKDKKSVSDASIAIPPAISAVVESLKAVNQKFCILLDGILSVLQNNSEMLVSLHPTDVVSFLKDWKEALELSGDERSYHNPELLTYLSRCPGAPLQDVASKTISSQLLSCNRLIDIFTSKLGALKSQ